MKIVKIICDRCGCEIEGNPYRITISRVDRQDGDTADYIDTPEHDFCGECVEAIVAGMIPAKEPEPEPEPVATETTQTTETTAPTTQTTEATPPRRVPRKTWITEAEKGEIAKRYRAGSEPEDIADDMNLLRPQVSRYIFDSGLGKERYGNSCPSGGGAPIPTVMVGGSLTGGSNWY